MNYADQINFFWIKDIKHHFSDKEVAFYFYLLHTCKCNNGNKKFGISNTTIVAKFGWGRQSLKNIKTKLKSAELIDYTPGQGRGNIDQYKILEKEKIMNSSNKQYNKQLKIESLTLPFSSDIFIKLWNRLLQAPKWREKPQSILQANLDKLKIYDEPFAIQLIEQTLLGNWQGLIFRDTDNQFRRWKDEQMKMNETKQDRRDEIVRRAAQAVASCHS